MLRALGKMALRSAIAVFLCLTASNAKPQLSLNRPNLLLPYAVDEASKSFFILKGICPTKCCFIWSTNKPEVALIEATDNTISSGSASSGGAECSVSARVVATSPHPTTKTAVVIAKDTISGQSLRCDVFISDIKRIEIRTTSKDLIVDEAPKALHVQAFDAKENMFTDLSNHPFVWNLVSFDGKDDPSIYVRLLTYSDSLYETSEENLKLERTGLKGDTILVEGLATGLVKVSARLVHSIWKNVNSYEVVLQVVENVQLIPSSDVYILQQSYVDFIVEKLKANRLLVLDMPSDQYILSSTNSSVGRLDSNLSRVTGLAIGETDVQLLSTQLNSSLVTRIPTTTVHVVPPAYLVFEISGRNWVVQTGKVYEITIHVYGSHNHRLKLTENVRIEASFPLGHLNVISSSENGSYHLVNGTKVGDVMLFAKLKCIQILGSDELFYFDHPLSAEQPMEILSPVTVTPKRVLLPWHPKTNATYRFKASGGSGNYDWSIDFPAISPINQSGVATVQQKGASHPKASDDKNSMIFDTSELHIVDPLEMEFLPLRLEALVDTTLDLPLAMKGRINTNDSNDLLPLDDCRHLNFSLNYTDQKIFEAVPYTNYTLDDLPAGACAILRVKALHPGHTALTAMYTRMKLSASVLIGAYNELEILSPPAPALVTIGSSFVYQFDGGPLPWPQEQRYFQDVEADSNALTVDPTSELRGARHEYKIGCRRLGDESITLKVGNRNVSERSFHVFSVLKATILCREPYSAMLVPSANVEKCPLFSRELAKEIHVAFDYSLQLELTVQEKGGRNFDNFTSLEWKWQTNGIRIIKTDLKNPNGNKGFVLLWERSTPETVNINVVSSSYSKRYVTDKQLAVLRRELKDHLLVKFQANPAVDPSSVTLFNHLLNTASLVVTNGSQFYELTLDSDKSKEIIKYHQELGSNEIIITPISDGQAILSVQDLCLVTLIPSPTATVRVTGIHSFDVKVPEKVQVDQFIEATVCVLDLWGIPIPFSQYKFINLQAHALAPILKFSNAQKRDSRSDCALFSIQGLVEGTTQILFNATAPDGHLITSEPETIQVYSRIQVKPDEIVLVPTALFQVQVIGGPRNDARIVFKALNESVAKVDTIGLIEAIAPGRTVVSVASEASDGSGTIYSEAEVRVIVVKLTGLKIRVPSDQIVVGSEVSAYVMGQYEEETPFSFASAVPQLYFHWKSSNDDLVSLHSVYHRAGVSLDSDPDFAVRLRADRVGQSTISVHVNCPPNVCSPDRTTLSSSAEVQILESLKLLSPASGRLLLPHRADYRVRTNRDGDCLVAYRIVSTIDGRNDDDPGPAQIDEEGHITTRSLDGAVIVVVTAVEPYGINQTVLIHLEVRPVVSLTINSLSSVRGGSDKFHAFPIGYSARFVLSFHDTIGREFDYKDMPVRHQVNRNDVVRVLRQTDDGAYRIKGVKLGQVIVKMQLSASPQISDYIRVRIDQPLEPKLATIHEGSTVCFLSLTPFTKGVWSSSEPRVLRIDPLSGKAHALSSGRALISNKDDDVVNTHVDVTVSPVRTLTISPLDSKSRPLSDCLPEAGCAQPDFSVEFFSDDNGRKFTDFHDCGPDCDVGVAADENRQSPNHSRQIDFACAIESDLEFYHASGKPGSVADLFDAVAHFDAATGESKCRVRAKGDAATSVVRTEGHVIVTARVADSTSASASVGVPFFGAFSLETNRVRLDGAHVTVAIFGSPKVLASLTVTSLSSALEAKMGAGVIDVALLSHPAPSNDEEFRVSISSSLIGQRQLLVVAYIADTKSQKANVRDDEEPSKKPPESIPVREVSATSNLILYVVVLLVLIFLASLCYLFGRSGSTGALVDAQPVTFEPVNPTTPPQPAFGSSRYRGKRSTPTPISGAGGATPFTPIAQSGHVPYAQKPKQYSAS